MNNDGLELIKRTIADLQARRRSAPPPAGLSPLNLLGSTPETPVEITKLQSALQYLTSDTGRGNGSFYGTDGQPEKDNWLAGVWAIASLGWPQGKAIAKNWSEQCPAVYTDEGFEKAWNGYQPNHPNPVGIASLYKRAMDLGWSPPANTTPQRYKLLNRVDIQRLLPVTWRIKGVFPAQGFAAMYGPSGSGKSFLVLDMAAAIASGQPWFGLKTIAAPVVYLWLEAESGIKNRVSAWEVERKAMLPADLRIVMQPFNLTVQQDVQDIARAIPAGSVIIIDTLNRAAPTSDENSSKEMGVILQACKEIQMLSAGLVVLIHHTGKDASKGARGHSSLFAALDGAIEVEHNATGRSWTIAKSKDGEGGTTFPFKLRVHHLGKDADGDDVTSCTVELAQGQIFQTREPTGKQQKPALRQLKAVLQKSADLGKAGCGVQTKCLPVEEAIKAIAITLTTVDKNKRNNRAKVVLDGLITGGTIKTGLDGDDGWVWL